MDQLNEHLQCLLEGSGAQAAVICTQPEPEATGSVLCTCPAELLPEGTAWPEAPQSAPGVIHRDPSAVTRLVPTTLRLELACAPTAAASVPLGQRGLSLLLVWCDSRVPEELPPDVRRLIEEQIAYHARLLDSERRSEQQALRLQAVLGSLQQGVVSVDHDRSRADVNPAAAGLLGLPIGEVGASEFAAAMRELESKVLDPSAAALIGTLLLSSSEANINCTLLFDKPPTHLRVESHPFRQGRLGGRVWLFDDISVEAEALEAVEGARALLRASTDSMIDPQVLLEAVRDPAGQVVDFCYRSLNRAACVYLDVSEQDLLGQSVLETLPNNLGSGLLKRYAQCVEDGEPVILTDFAYFNELLDDARHYDIRATRAGHDLLTLNWEDVTERFQAAQRIAESEQRYRLLADNSSDLIAHIRDDTVVWVSPSVEAILGAPVQYWLGRNVFDAIPSEDQPANRASMAAAVAGGTVRERVRLVSADGVTHWLDLHAKPFYDDAGRQDGVTASLRLIDDEVAAEQQVEEARRQQARADAIYRRSMESAAVGMCLADLEGNFTEVNATLCEFFGYDAESLLHKTWQDLTAPDYLQADLDKRAEVLAGDIEAYRMVKQFIHADGHRIWGDLAVSCVRDADGHVEIFLAQIADITTEVETRQRLAEELASAASYMASIMPRGLTGHVNMSSLYLPSRELGGDCFDYRWIDDDHLVVYLLDVSGHGLEPALLAASLQNMLRSGTFTTEALLEPATVLTELNRLFQMEQQNDHYFTAWYAVYDKTTRTLRYANAGAPPAYAFDATTANSSTTTELGASSTPVGVFEDTEFITDSYYVPHGHRILIYSDGVTDVVLGDGRQLSQEGFKKLATQQVQSPNWSLDDLIHELRDRAPTGAFEDDCSLILMAFD